MTDVIYREESYRLIGACFEVYKEKGCGFLEAVLVNFGHFPKVEWERIVH